MLPIHFAPLQGYTEDAFRRIHNELCGGIAEYYTPFVRMENGGVRSKDLRDLKPEHNKGVAVTPQVIAKDACELRTLLDVILPMGYQKIDINMGCPFPLQTRHGRGAGILPHPGKVQEICDAIRQYPDVMFSVKMRLGLTSSDEWKEVMPLLNAVPLRHITLHPRVASLQYKGEVDMESFEAFTEACKHPLIYNGDVATLSQLQLLEEKYNLAGIMIGRGLLARPTLAAEYLSGKEMDTRERIQKARQMHDRLLAHLETVIPSEAQRLTKIRTFWDFMEEELGRKVWKKIMKAGNMKNYLAALP